MSRRKTIRLCLIVFGGLLSLVSPFVWAVFTEPNGLVTAARFFVYGGQILLPTGAATAKYDESILEYSAYRYSRKFEDKFYTCNILSKTKGDLNHSSLWTLFLEDQYGLYFPNSGNHIKLPFGLLAVVSESCGGADCDKAGIKVESTLGNDGKFRTYRCKERAGAGDEKTFVIEVKDSMRLPN